MNTSTDTTVAGGQAMLRMIPLADIGPCPTNPRTTIDPATIAELAASIKVQGVLQPILVRLATKGHQACEIVAGHRRFAAAKLAGLTEMPAIVRALSDVEVLRVQLIENLQREGLHEMEEGEGYQRLMRDHSYTARQIADEVGKSIEYIYARVKLCALSPECRQAFRDGKLSASTAVLVARIPSDKLQLQAMQDITGANNQYTHDVMSHRAAQRHIQERYMLSLEKAPFDTRASRYFLTKKDKEPLPSCYECPKRTGACPELFTDVKSPDTCTDPTCFTAKRDGEHAHLVAEAERKARQSSPARPPKRFSRHRGIDRRPRAT
jgi:ParB/RepB/Spo0J family partition protein